MTTPTHECSACLQDTIKGSEKLSGSLVLPFSACPAGGRHNWLPIETSLGPAGNIIYWP